MADYKYIIFTDLDDANSFVASTDELLGYPETEDKFFNVGGGSHADWSVGAAQHYCTPTPNQDSTAWFVLYTDCVTLPEGATAVDELPEGWYPVMEGV